MTTNPFKQPKPGPPTVIIYGQGGIGKTTLGAHMPSPVFLQPEEGLKSGQKVDASGLIKSYKDMVGMIDWLITAEHKYQTVVLDGIDSIEKLIREDICSVGVKTLADFPYGKGYELFKNEWERLTDKLTLLNQKKKMIILLLGHSKISRVEIPGSDPYDQNSIEIDKRGFGKLFNWADIVLFLSYRVSIIQQEGSFGNIKTKALGDGSRILYTSERPAYKAKNRYSFPHEIEVEDGAPENFWPEMKKLILAAGNKG